MGSGDHDRRRRDEAAKLETRTAQLDPTELARLVGKTMPEQTRAAIVRTDTEQSIPLERPPVREDERPTGEMIPTELAELRDQAKYELEPEHSDTPTTELDPSVLRAMMATTPLPPLSPGGLAVPTAAAMRDPARSIKTEIVRPLTATRNPARSMKTEIVRPLTANRVPAAFAWQRALLLAIAVIAVVVGFALTR